MNKVTFISGTPVIMCDSGMDFDKILKQIIVDIKPLNYRIKRTVEDGIITGGMIYYELQNQGMYVCYGKQNFSAIRSILNGYRGGYTHEN